MPKPKLDPTIKTILLEDKPPTLKEAQEIVGGWIEPITLLNGQVMLVNEEGLIHQLPYNPTASMMAGRPIVGNVVVLAGKAKKGWS